MKFILGATCHAEGEGRLLIVDASGATAASVLAFGGP